MSERTSLSVRIKARRLSLNRFSFSFDESLSWFLEDYDLNEAARLAREKVVAIVFLSADSGEGE